MTGPLYSRSMRIQKYVSRTMSMASATMTLETGMPSGGVCLVISLCPIIEFTSSGTLSASLVKCTPPYKKIATWKIGRFLKIICTGCVAPQKVLTQENGRMQEKNIFTRKNRLLRANYHRVANKIKCWYLENQLQQVLVILVKMHVTKD